MENNIEIIMSDSNKNDINIETNFEEAVEMLYAVDKVFTRDEVQEMLYKARAIAENLNTLEAEAYKEGEETVATLDGEPLNKRFMQEAKEIKNVKRILIDIDVAYDEFYLMYDKNNFLPNSCRNVEVVTKEVAEGNDKDFDATTEEGYKVGEGLSYYRKLGDSGYYFRFL